MAVPAIRELSRRRAPAERPQALAFDGSRLWLSSLATRRLYLLDPESGDVVDDGGETPGRAWGMTVVRGELRVVDGTLPDDDRYVYRYVPARGFADALFRCPDDAGSHLAWDGTTLYLSQWYRRRILALDEHGVPTREIAVPRQICALTWADGGFWALTLDDEGRGPYYLTRVERDGAARDVARIDFPARALAYDGNVFWTNHREAHETVAFSA